MKQKLWHHLMYIFGHYLIFIYAASALITNHVKQGFTGQTPAVQICSNIAPLGWSSIPSVQGDPIPQRHHLPENTTTLASTSAPRAKALRGKEGMLWAPLAREGSIPCFTWAPLVTTMVPVGSPSPHRR